MESESKNLGSIIVSPHYNLRTTVALLPHNQHTMWTQPEYGDDVVDEVDDDDDDDLEHYHEPDDQPLHLHGLHGSLHNKKSRKKMDEYSSNPRRHRMGLH